MKKRIKLRKEIKNILAGIALIALFASIVIYGVNRFEKINNGEMILVNQSEMNR